MIRSLNRTFARIRRRNVIAPSTKRPACEQLEDRRLMSLALMTPGQPIISEFLAINDTGLQDADGDRSDWIELHNPTPSDVNLDGWLDGMGLARDVTQRPSDAHAPVVPRKCPFMLGRVVVGRFVQKVGKA